MENGNLMGRAGGSLAANAALSLSAKRYSGSLLPPAAAPTSYRASSANWRSMVTAVVVDTAPARPAPSAADIVASRRPTATRDSWVT